MCFLVHGVCSPDVDLDGAVSEESADGVVETEEDVRSEKPLSQSDGRSRVRLLGSCARKASVACFMRVADDIER